VKAGTSSPYSASRSSTEATRKVMVEPRRTSTVLKRAISLPFTKVPLELVSVSLSRPDGVSRSVQCVPEIWAFAMR